MLAMLGGWLHGGGVVSRVLDAARVCYSVVVDSCPCAALCSYGATCLLGLRTRTPQSDCVTLSYAPL